MEIQFLGANSLLISTKKSSLVTDPYLYGTELPKDVLKKSGIVLMTQKWEDAKLPSENFVINTPGEYEVSDFSIKSMPTMIHSDDPKLFPRGVIYKIQVADYNLAILGHSSAPLSDEQIEFLGIVDILCLPIGGNGYSIETPEAVQIVKAIEPKIIIPTHRNDKSIHYPVPQDDEKTFISELGITPENEEKLKLKGLLAEVPRIVVLKPWV
jgi:L-ascorbate metabolism protein UlaG (beta-lactamase superfamily)